MITKDGKNLPILEVTPENYLVPRGEESQYHVKLEVKSFDPHTGERLSHPYIQKFAPIDFENGTMSILRQQGYDMVILHNPREWSKGAAEEAARKKAEAEAKAKAEAEAEREALRAKLKEELLAEMKTEAEAKAKAEAEAKKKTEAEAKKKTKAEAKKKAQKAAEADAENGKGASPETKENEEGGEDPDLS